MNREVYAHLLKTFGRKPGYWVGIAGTIVTSLLIRVYTVILIAQMTGKLVAGDIEGAKADVITFLAIYVFGIIISAVADLIAARSENDTYTKTIVDFYTKLVSKDMTFYRDHQTGYLTSLFRQHLDSGMQLVRLFRGNGMRMAVSLVAPVLVLFTINWKLGVASLAIILVQIGYIIWSSALANTYREKSHEIYRRVTAEVADTITNIVAFKSSGQESSGKTRIKALAQEENQSFWQRRMTTTMAEVPRGILTVVGMAATLFIVLLEAGTGQADSATVGLLVLTTTYIFQIVRNVGDIPGFILEHDDLVTKSQPTLKYLRDTDQTIADPAKPKKLSVNKGSIAITDVGFDYNSGKNKVTVFKNLNISIKGGERIGIVGLSGAGKSTLASLLVRFDDVKTGTIAIDGTDIRTVRQSDLRQKIAYVPQEPLLFHRSVRDNITYFKPHATNAEIERAAKAAHAHDFVTKLPDGYNTIVGERGVKLSGGQKQRIVIARAVLKNAPIIIFDEATSALDSESEHLIQQALPQIIGKHTAIVIAHRLSTIAGLDRIIVMHNGQVTEQGTHQQLLAQRGHYFTLWQKQTKH